MTMNKLYFTTARSLANVVDATSEDVCFVYLGCITLTGLYTSHNGFQDWGRAVNWSH